MPRPGRRPAGGGLRLTTTVERFAALAPPRVAIAVAAAAATADVAAQNASGRLPADEVVVGGRPLPGGGGTRWRHALEARARGARTAAATAGVGDPVALAAAA